MTQQDRSITPDLDFLRTLIDGTGGRTQYYIGQAFLVAGCLYGFQCLATGLALVTGATGSTLLMLFLGFAPTVAFIVYCIWLNIAKRMAGGGSTTSRAVAAVFQAMGLANIAMICIFAPAAFMRGDFTIWLFYPAVVFALQGAAWLTVFQLRRRGWLLLVAMGWLLSAVALGALIAHQVYYLIVCGAALFLFMAAPGWTMMKLAARQD